MTALFEHIRTEIPAAEIHVPGDAVRFVSL